MMGKAYKQNNAFDKASFRYQRGPELSNKQKKQKVEQAGSCKWYVQEHCEYQTQSLCKILPAALKSVASEAINQYSHRCIRVLDAYATGYKYGSTAFKEHVYKGHRQVVDKSKW
jgi:hypothetical protein